MRLIPNLKQENRKAGGFTFPIESLAAKFFMARPGLRNIGFKI